jgi:osmotically-inducible protein OsmY
MADYERNPDHGWARTGDFGTMTDDDIDRERERTNRTTTHSRLEHREWGREADRDRWRTVADEARHRFAGRGPKGYRRSDAAIFDEVCVSLTRHPDVDASEVEVQVENGVVVLRGAVTDRHQKRAAEDAALVRGVSDVDNQLRIGARTEMGR